MASAVLFDLDDTLYDSTKQVSLARENAVTKMIEQGLHCSQKNALAVLDEIASVKGSNYPHHFDDLVEIFGKPFSYDIVASGVIAYHETKRKYMKPFPKLKKTIIQLRKKGYLVGVVSDGIPTKQWEKLIRLGLTDFFDCVVIAEKKSYQKPSPIPFEYAAKNLGVPAGECVVVGDRVDKDILGAHNAGMQAIQLLQGRHSKIKPEKIGETPDYIISDICDVAGVIEGLD
ncbi:MAG: TIGR02253 family HAD-type hydrolase [Candidatus Altiarchaeota archaeon]|nr:TIGR02253 family HAD-type hydrolase [Candidatus Altiarchaeota archaeon]